MLTLQVEDNQVVLLAFFFQVIVILQQSLIEIIQLGIPGVEHRLAQLRVIQEEAATKIVYLFSGLRQELVGEEGHMITRLTEKLREERIVTPLTLITYCIHREEMLEDITGKVPGRHHVSIGDQLSFPCALQLQWCRLFLITIEL